LIAAEAGAIERVHFRELRQREGEPELTAGDPSRLRDEVEFHPTVGLARGIAETVGWRLESMRGRIT
jgi:hypothetical protein